ncbi:MAG: HAD family hydrolase [Spirochaetales bacterium]|nr:HAD family hydrolase [Spirochaetales bacterium]
MGFTAIGFDIDGTLYANYKMFLHSLPAGLFHPRLSWNFGKVRKEIRRIRPVHNFRHLQAQLLAGHMGMEPEHAFALMERFLYQSWETSFRGIKPLNGVKAVLLDLKSRGFKLAALSDFPAARKLEYLGLTGMWDTAFSSEDTQYLKPHPEPFLEMASRLDTPPENILYVGNSYRYDVLGAKGVGMCAAHYSSRPKPRSKADFTFFDYKDLRDFILENSGI